MKNKYDDDHIAEIYDQIEKHSDDIPLLTEYITQNKIKKVLEPFCGTGRILLPLAKLGVEITGIDQSESMLKRLKKRLDDEGLHSSLIHADVLKDEWPKDFEMVIIGGNSLYEFGTENEQKKCIEQASNAMESGSLLYLENDNMEGELDKSWQKLDTREHWFPSGVCEDGTKLDTTVTTDSFDTKKRIWRATRITKIEYPNGETKIIEQKTQTHPSSAIEIEDWLKEYGFKIIDKYSSAKKEPYYTGCKRAIFWAQKI